MNSSVYLVRTNPGYPQFPYGERDNNILAALSLIWKGMGLDPENPFRDWLAPGSRALIKPNWVRHYNPLGETLACLITHPSLIKCLLDFCARAMRGQGTIVVGDCPLQGCDFRRLMDLCQFNQIAGMTKEKYPGIEIHFEDWRLTVYEGLADEHRQYFSGSQYMKHPGIPEEAQNYKIVELGKSSFLEEIAEYSDRFRVTMYNPKMMGRHHRPGKHDYLVTRRIFDLDLMINLPKMKTHSKVGLTGAMKNLVGINGHKEFLPHHLKGAYFDGGDGYCVANPLQRLYDNLYDYTWERFMGLSTLQKNFYSYLLYGMRRIARLTGADSITAGGWSGNNTLWRTVLDLNHILYFSENSPKQVLTIVDGIIGGEGEGPLRPTPKPLGLLVAGENPAYIDAVLAKTMGYNVANLPTVYHAINHRNSRFAGPDLREFQVRVLNPDGGAEDTPLERLPVHNFKKPKFWKRAESVLKV